MKEVGEEGPLGRRNAKRSVDAQIRILRNDKADL